MAESFFKRSLFVYINLDPLCCCQPFDGRINLLIIFCTIKAPDTFQKHYLGVVESCQPVQLAGLYRISILGKKYKNFNVLKLVSPQQ